MLASPFLYVDLFTQDYTSAGPQHSAMFGFLFMTGMICAVIGLYLIDAAGPKARWLLLLQLGFLSFAQAYNLNVMINGETLSSLQAYLDWFRPVSYLFMLVVGIPIAAAGKISGWKAFAPLLTGIWAPLALWIFTIHPSLSTHVAGLFSSGAWLLTGWVIYKHPAKELSLRSQQIA